MTAFASRADCIKEIKALALKQGDVLTDEQAEFVLNTFLAQCRKRVSGGVGLMNPRGTISNLVKLEVER